MGIIAMGVSNVYLDSFYLLALINDEDRSDDVEQMLYDLRQNTFNVLVPFIVLGEVCGVVFRDSKSDQDRREKIVKMLNIVIDNKIQWENIRPTEKDAFNIMVTLRDKDSLLDTTDIMILSHVLSDPDSKFFFTTDKKILYNKEITDLEKSLRDEDKRSTLLKIQDNF